MSAVWSTCESVNFLLYYAYIYTAAQVILVHILTSWFEPKSWNEDDSDPNIRYSVQWSVVSGASHARQTHSPIPWSLRKGNHLIARWKWEWQFFLFFVYFKNHLHGDLSNWESRRAGTGFSSTSFEGSLSVPLKYRWTNSTPKLPL